MFEDIIGESAEVELVCRRCGKKNVDSTYNTIHHPGRSVRSERSISYYYYNCLDCGYKWVLTDV